MLESAHSNALIYNAGITFTRARLHAFSPRVNKFAGDFVCTLPDPSAATTTAAAFAGLERAAFGTSRGHRVNNGRFGSACGRTDETNS